MQRKLSVFIIGALLSSNFLLAAVIAQPSDSTPIPLTASDDSNSREGGNVAVIVFKCHFPDTKDKVKIKTFGDSLSAVLDKRLNEIEWRGNRFSVFPPCLEMARNIMMHGGGGDIEMFYYESTPKGAGRLIAIGIDSGPGIDSPDKLLQESIKIQKKWSEAMASSKLPHTEIPKTGYGMHNICIYPNEVTYETRGVRWVKDGGHLEFPPRSPHFLDAIDSVLVLKRAGVSSVVKGTKITLVWLSDGINLNDDSVAATVLPPVKPAKKF